MISRLYKWICPVVLFLGFHSSLPAQDSVWVFEGLITKADSKLAPDLQSGWVLSGSFTLTALDMEEEIPTDDNRAGRFSGGITDGELTIDLYHQLHFAAQQVPGMAGLDYKDNDSEENGRDLYGWFIPIRGKLKESGWSSRWLQVWLSDSEGRMIHTVPPSISPYGIKAESKWFRLTMENEEGETAFVDGTMEYFGPLDELEDGQPEEDWAGVAAELSRELIKRDQTIAGLREELARSKARIESLRHMVDLMIEERNALEAENQLLADKVESADPEIEAAMTELQTDKALLEDELENLTAKNVSLTDSLAESEYQRRTLARELEAAEQAILESGFVAEPVPEPVVVTVTSDEGQEVGTMAVIEQPADPDDPIILKMPLSEAPVEPAVVPPEESLSPPPDPAPVKKEKKSRRKGPRKFR